MNPLRTPAKKLYSKPEWFWVGHVADEHDIHYRKWMDRRWDDMVDMARERTGWIVARKWWRLRQRWWQWRHINPCACESAHHRGFGWYDTVNTSFSATGTVRATWWI